MIIPQLYLYANPFLKIGPLTEIEVSFIKSKLYSRKMTCTLSEYHHLNSNFLLVSLIDDFSITATAEFFYLFSLGLTGQVPCLSFTFFFLFCSVILPFISTLMSKFSLTQSPA